MTKVCIFGSREFTDFNILDNKVNECLSEWGLSNVVIVSGMARGVDLLGVQYAKKYGLKVIPRPANWSLGKRAGYIRNEVMANEAEYFIGFSVADSKGTASMIKLVWLRQKPLKIFKFDKVIVENDKQVKTVVFEEFVKRES